MGRHTGNADAAAGTSRSSLSVIAMMTILTLVLLGFALRGFNASDSDATVSSRTTQESPTADPGDEAAATQITPSMGEESDAPASDPAGADAAEQTAAEPQAAQESDDTVPVALQACQIEVSTGEDWAGATSESASHWKQHYQASVDYNAGDITLKEAEDNFAASKAKGDADVKAVTASQEAYEDAAGACAKMSAEDLPAHVSEVAQACRERAEAIDKAIPLGTEVNGDWSAHLEMMKSKDDTDPAEYDKRWQMMVQMAPDGMEPYEEAAAVLEDAPECTTT